MALIGGRPDIVRLGVAGCGAIATSVHLPNLADIAGVGITALADPDPAALARAMHEFPGAHGATDWRSLLERDNVDAVLVALPAQLHAEAACDILSAGRHLYLEKPVATRLADAYRVRDAATRAGTVAMIGFNYRFNPLYEQLRDAIVAGAVGEVIALRTIFSTHGRRAGWRADLQTEGVLLDLASHHVDLVRFMTGRPVESVSAVVAGPGAAGDTAGLTLHLDNGVIAQSVFCAAGPEQDMIEVIGDAGSATVRRYESVAVELHGRDAAGARRDQVRNVMRAVRAAPYLRDKLRSPGNEPSYGLALDHFVQCVLSDRPAEPGLDEGVASLAVIDAAIRSASTGARTPVERVPARTSLDSVT